MHAYVCIGLRTNSLSNDTLGSLNKESFPHMASFCFFIYIDINLDIESNLVM